MGIGHARTVNGIGAQEYPMFGQGKRAAILELHKQGHAVRKIAQALRASRNTVRNIIRSGTAEVPKIVRPSKAEAHRVQILELYSRCRGSLVRLKKNLLPQGAQFLTRLTRFVRREGISKKQSGLRHTHP